MRFRKLGVPAFGPFTDFEQEFVRKEGDLHILYGPNEAGKSSLLRAITELLFGIPHNSKDDFLHKSSKMRLTAEIENKAGGSLSFKRRKGRGNTLLDINDNPLLDTALDNYKGSVDNAYFTTVFGLGSSELENGAKQLLQGTGDLGEALFSTSTGGLPLVNALNKLDSQAKLLFNGRATTNVTLRPLVNELNELREHTNAVSVNPQKWTDLQTEMLDLQQQIHKIDEEIAQLDRERMWIERCESALPFLTRIREKQSCIEALGKLPESTPLSIQQVQKALEEYNQTSKQRERLKGRTKELESELGFISIKPAVLQYAADIDELYAQSGAYNEQSQSLVAANSKLERLRKNIDKGMKQQNIIGPISVIEQHKVSRQTSLESEQTVDSLQKLKEKTKHQQTKIDNFSAALEDCQLNLLPTDYAQDNSALNNALEQAAETRDASRSVQSDQSRCKTLQLELEQQHARLRISQTDFKKIASLAVPAKSTIKRFRDNLDKLERKLEDARAIGEQEKNNLHRVNTELMNLQNHGEVYTDAMLDDARNLRDHGWALVLAAWQGNGKESELLPGLPLNSAYPQTVRDADKVADVLRDNTETIAQTSEKQSQIAQHEKRILQIDEQCRDLQQKLQVEKETWKQAWNPCDIKPESPWEMEEWREAWTQFRDKFNELQSLQSEIEKKSVLIEKAVLALSAATDESLEPGFEHLYRLARTRASQAEQARGARSQLEKQTSELKKGLEVAQQQKIQLNKELQQAIDEWQKYCNLLNFSPDLSPTIGLTLIKEREALIKEFDEWQETSDEIKRLKNATEAFKSTVNDFSQKLGVDQETIASRIKALWQSVSSTRDNANKKESLAVQIKSLTREIADTDIKHKQALQELQRFRASAELADDTDIAPVVEQIKLQQQLKSDIEQFHSSLTGFAQSETVAEFIIRVEQEETDDLSSRKIHVKSALAERNMSQKQLIQNQAALNSRKAEFEKANDLAAVSEQKATTLEAQIKHDADRFVRLRMAAHFIKCQIEEFRENNQGPMLEKSSRYFNELTLRSFDGLRTDYDKNDNPILVGYRPGGDMVRIDGMSDGTRDQLYLSLRLAALERHLADHEPMPLILDDLLITFDDERAKALLLQLHRLAERTQVFLFTHHQHVVKLCQDTLAEDQFSLHDLPQSYSLPSQ